MTWYLIKLRDNFNVTFIAIATTTVPLHSPLQIDRNGMYQVSYDEYLQIYTFCISVAYEMCQIDCV
jgi:hypothetical protein